MERTTYELYSYFRSSCSARIRIAALLKGIKLEYKYINLLKDEQNQAPYTSVNSSHLVPTLIVKDHTGEQLVIHQSVAILEYLEESRPDLPALLPKTPKDRALVRELVNIVACDLQPVTNLRILNRIRPLGIDANEWQQDFMGRGLQAYEEVLIRNGPSKFSFGDSVTLADLSLIPAVDGAVRFGVDVEKKFPNIYRIYNEAQQLPAFREGGWQRQSDTPEALRAKD
ncbi:Maleylacetoacetate isomerase-like protein [Elsinoe fawcettii]|nr:Maleylacetoacetate isomerase-like protein [Elsinoe fawcettii]